MLKLIEIIESNIILAPLLVFIAGVLASFTPCSLSSVPLVIGYVGSGNVKKPLFLSIVFAIGMSITFTILGLMISLFGSVISFNNEITYIFLGLLMIAMALQLWEVINIIPSKHLKNSKRGTIGALTTGMLAGFFSSPCSTPVLIVILALISTSNLLYGMFLLFLYSLGHSILTIIAGTSTNFVKRLSSSSKYGFISSLIKYLLGIVILLIGFYLFYLGV